MSAKIPSEYWYQDRVDAQQRLCHDSRQVEPGDHFFAWSADATARQAHCQQAQERGATACYEPDDVADLRHLAAWVAARRSGASASRVPLLGVTGTDGKSTTVLCAWHCLGAGAARCGTLGVHDGQHLQSALGTTPAPEAIHSWMTALAADCPGAVLECSSHAGLHRRIAGLSLHGLVWTGLRHDHLDVHGDADRYAEAKLRLVDQLGPGSLCIINADDTSAFRVAHRARACGARCISLGFDDGELRLRRDVEGTWRLHGAASDQPLQVPLVGRHNIWNAAAGALLARAAGVSLSTALARLARLPTIPGRMQRCSETPPAFVDYAHTPQAISVVIAAAREAYPDREIICCFGCGGERDRAKRPLMAAAAEAADWVMVTSDNPRGEDPERIIDGIVAERAVAQRAEDWQARQPWCRIAERREAIRAAWTLASQRNAVLLLCGKGHETTQEIAGQIHPWSDIDALHALACGKGLA